MPSLFSLMIANIPLWECLWNICAITFKKRKCKCCKKKIKKNFKCAKWKQVFVIQWVWWKDQKTLSDQDSLWQSFLSSAGSLVGVFSASQSRNLEDFYFLLQSCADGACPLHNTAVSMYVLLHWDVVCYFCAMLCACIYIVSASVYVCVCFYVCMVVAWAGVYVFSASVTCQEAPLLCCWVPPLQTH